MYDIPGGDNDYVVAVGAPDDGFAAGTGPGAAYVFNVDTTSPTLTLLDKIPGSASSISSTDATGTPHAGFGSDVAFDGDTLLVSAPFNDDAGADAGAVSVFLGNGALTTFTEQAVLYPCGVGACSATGGEFFGVGLDLDAETAAIGATSLGSAIGRVHVFDRDGSTWSATQDFTAATAASDDLFGIDVDIENDVILVGSFAGGASDEGEAFVFRNVAGAWTEEASLTGPDAVGGDQVGGSVSLSPSVDHSDCRCSTAAPRSTSACALNSWWLSVACGNGTSTAGRPTAANSATEVAPARHSTRSAVP